jgi:hypothetical protein
LNERLQHSNPFKVSAKHGYGDLGITLVSKLWGS